MKTTHWLLCALVALPTIAGAQSRIVTPFTPREVDSTGKKVYVDPQPETSRRSISIGYGFMPATMSNSIVDFQKLAYADPRGKIYPQLNSSSGTISASFGYEATPWLEVNLAMAYTRNWGTYNSEYVETSRDNWFIILPSARINWLRNSWFSLYSRVGAGPSFVNREFGTWVYISDPDWVDDPDDDSDEPTMWGVSMSTTASAMAFAWQLTPIGVEMGKGRVCFFAEGGYGFMGTVNVGLKLKVGKRLPGGTMSNGRDQGEWYEKYMRM